MTHEEKSEAKQHGYEVFLVSGPRYDSWRIAQHGDLKDGEYGRENDAWSRIKELIAADRGDRF
ncbi:hypothetical protein [Pseudomonas sp.]|uniref:hypothetical protein n=1 Tax=Pseudomonas sp. TaxID=306 RepID=UPI003F31873D